MHYPCKDGYSSWPSNALTWEFAEIGTLTREKCAYGGVALTAESRVASLLIIVKIRTTLIHQRSAKRSVDLGLRRSAVSDLQAQPGAPGFWDHPASAQASLRELAYSV